MLLLDWAAAVLLLLGGINAAVVGLISFCSFSFP
jgi:uncharacterized membrane protein YuzA (DUF378 family)